jgi:proteasome lid subunit RPN8/RPN11
VVRVPRAVLAAIDAHARAAAPRECCGLLLGLAPPASDVTEIRRAEPTGNIAPEPTRYQIDPADHFRAIREARAAGLSVIGAYHSHPASAPVPSPTDLAEALPAFLYLIVSLRSSAGDEPLDRRTRVYYIEGAMYREVPLVLADRE